MSQIVLYAAIAAAVVIAFTTLAYVRGWEWTGFAERRRGDEVLPARTLWDWLQLLVVPLALAAVAVLFNQWQSDREQRREDRRAAEVRVADRNRAARAERAAADAARNDALRRYLDAMSELMLDRQLLKRPKLDAPNIDAPNNVARTLTLTTLRQLDGERKGEVVRFLAQAGLLEGDRSSARVVLEDADLRGAKLSGALPERRVALWRKLERRRLAAQFPRSCRVDGGRSEERPAQKRLVEL